ncbi:hypothetical protein [Asticcacaulis sp. AC402]|uniref:hypothetical protein n=1 Tax=Asticcacaulis sp. AC402 TaxID=1282361 RepID=UPI0003C3D1D3|nr:hypothetical protein [Asticcacaulis sp. AC402]ESQ76727.1 hypothetical protein ABAC402_03360 [Asticcacaulis sp. AC402]
MIRTSLAVVLATCALLAAGPAFSQNGRFSTGEPLATSKPFADMTLVRERAGQAALQINVARALAPDFEVTGEVTIVDGPLKDGFLGLAKNQVVLSVPVRFRQAATLDADFAFDNAKMYKGTQMYRRFLPQTPGARTGYEDWCGSAFVVLHNNKVEKQALCFGKDQTGEIKMYTSTQGYGEGDAFYRFPQTDGDSGSIRSASKVYADYKGGVPSMTPQVPAPGDMTAELLAFPSSMLDNRFVWSLRKGNSTIALGFSNETLGNMTRKEGEVDVLRMAWLDLAFTKKGSRFIYEGYVDLVAENPELADKATSVDDTIAGAPARPVDLWRLGTLDLDPNSLVIDSSKAATEGVTLTFKGRFHRKVRLLETSKKRYPMLDQPDQQGTLKAGEIFYETLVDGNYNNGQPYFLSGWCGGVAPPKLFGATIHATRMTCFSPDEIGTTSFWNHAEVWETVPSYVIERGSPSFTPRLPRYEEVALGPDDVRNVVLYFYRNKKEDNEGAYAYFRVAIKDAESLRIQRTIRSRFDDSGKAVFILWDRRLIVTKQGETSVSVEMQDGGDGLGARWLR